MSRIIYEGTDTSALVNSSDYYSRLFEQILQCAIYIQLDKVGPYAPVVSAASS